MDLKKFFEQVSNLPLEEKIVKVFETFFSENGLDEANTIALKLISRDKTCSLQEKEQLLHKYFPEGAPGLLAKVKEASRKKPHNLTNQLHLINYIKMNMNKGGMLHFVQPTVGLGANPEITKERNKRFLNTIAAFLTQKRERNEYVDKHDCQLIMKYLIVDLYPEYQDQMNAIIHVAFRFKKQRIKQSASRFYDEVICRTGKIDKVLFLLLLRGSYLSEEVYTLLMKHANLIIEDESLCADVITEVRRLQDEDRNASNEERQMICRALDQLTTQMNRKK